jgi:hypothetical protein
MRGALDGRAAQNLGATESPLVKFHGCLHIDREKTLWTTQQLVDPKITDRINTCSDWMKLVLPGKDLLVVGFWTDWGYLNDVLANALSAGGFNSVTVVDPSAAATLQTKAPAFWTSLTTGTPHFQHVQASGSDALAELQIAFSRVWLKKFYALAKPLLEAEGTLLTFRHFWNMVLPSDCEKVTAHYATPRGPPQNSSRQLPQQERGWHPAEKS